MTFERPVTMLVGEHGFRRTTWEDLALVDHWRRYMNNPTAYLRHITQE